MEKQESMTHMNRCIEEERRKAGMAGNVLESAPAWVPDAEAEECMRCHKTHFSTIQRRHHCRKCGYVVCNSCSSNKAIIQHQSAKPLRVCDVCYDVVTNPSTTSVTSSNTKSVALFSMPRQIGAIADSSDSDDGNDTNQ
uniref:ZF(FYVE)-9 zinc finger protein ZF9 n=1 Tax=Phallusia mammillata TaxID=59560 RepID=A0A6F9DPN2_9ASCI|nr:ZF(FYVE)-9 zinc finger protein ZF9 [Phallusia mammillata]